MFPKSDTEILKEKERDGEQRHTWITYTHFTALKESSPYKSLIFFIAFCKKQNK